MNRQRLLTLIAISFAGIVLALSNTAHSDDDNGGLRFFAVLTGAQEVPPVATEGSGRIEARFDTGLTRVDVHLRVDANNLSGPARRAHFHCALPGQNGPIAFGLFEPGRCDFDGRQTRCTLRNEDFTGADCVPNVGRPVNNIAALAFAMREGFIYANVHTDEFPGGEIRGQMQER